MTIDCGCLVDDIEEVGGADEKAEDGGVETGDELEVKYAVIIAATITPIVPIIATMICLSFTQPSAVHYFRSDTNLHNLCYNSRD